MKKKTILKLTLSRETLRELTLITSSLVQGGYVDGEQIETCYNSCPSVCPCGGNGNA